jgi:hypothetical protein
MTRMTTARIAGFAFLLYIAAGISSMALGSRPPATDVLSLLMSFSALLLGVTLFAITRDQDHDLALFAMACRIVEAIPGDARRNAIFFAVSSVIFCSLLLRGRLIPVALAWLGVVASVLLVVILPLQLAGLLGGRTSWSASITWLVWMPMLVFEVALAFWLLVKGVATSAPSGPSVVHAISE